jgi:surface antigen
MIPGMGDDSAPVAQEVMRQAEQLETQSEKLGGLALQAQEKAKMRKEEYVLLQKEADVVKVKWETMEEEAKAMKVQAADMKKKANQMKKQSEKLSK